jgi:alkylation response protein AidB-like acyl-CoA dehydrogenase
MTTTKAPPDAATLLAAAKAFRSRIEAAAPGIEEARALPRDLVDDLSRANLFRMIVPRSVGGSELTLAAYSRVLEEIAKADASTAWCVSQASGISLVSGWLPHASALEIFGTPETGICAWGHGPVGAVEVPGGYRLSGQWAFASGIHHAAWLGSNQCPIVDDAGRPVLDERGVARRCIVLFPKSEAEIIDVWQVSGMKGTGSDSYRVKDLFVPREHSTVPLAQEPGVLYCFGTTNVFSVGFASVALGIARGMLDAFLELSAQKRPRGRSEVVREQAVVQSRVGRAEATLRAARAFLHTTVDEVWEEVSRTRRVTLDHRIMLRLATTHAIQRSAGVVDEVYQMAGSTAIFTNQPFERRFRDMHGVTQQVQGRSDHFETVGRYLMGIELTDLQFL